MCLRGTLSDRAVLEDEKGIHPQAVMMQRSEADRAGVNTPGSLMCGENASKWMLFLPFFRTDISVKKLSRLTRR